MLNEIKIHLIPTIELNRLTIRYTIRGFPGLSLIAKLLLPLIIRRLKPDNLTVTSEYITCDIPPIPINYQLNIEPITITLRRYP